MLALVAASVIGKRLASFGLMRMLGQSTRSSLIIGGSLAQIGEFSIIVAGLGVSLGVFTHDTQSKVVPAALIAITVNQSTLAGASRMLARSDEETARRRSWRPQSITVVNQYQAYRSRRAPHVRRWRQWKIRSISRGSATTSW